MKNKKRLSLSTLAALLMTLPLLNAEDWPHWLGPNGDNIASAADNFDPDLRNWKIAWHLIIRPGLPGCFIDVICFLKVILRKVGLSYLVN